MNRPREPQRFAQGNPTSPENAGVAATARDLRQIRRRAIRQTERFLRHQLPDLRGTEPFIAVGESALLKL
jgi:hypothetical protein